LARRAVVESKLTFFEEQQKVLTRGTVVFSENTFGLAPEVFDTVDVVAAAFYEVFGVINAVMFEAHLCFQVS